MPTQTEVISYIEEMNERLDDKNQREIFTRHYLDTENSRNTEKRYQVISEMVNNKYGKGTISKTTVWRVLKIQQTSAVTFNEVKQGECSVKTAYAKLFPAPEKKIEQSNSINSLGDLCEYVKGLNAYYKENEHKLENPPVKEMRALDDQLFVLRKTLNKIIANSEEY